MATVKELVATHGEDKVVKMCTSYLKSADRRKQYTASAEAKQAATERRKKMNEELKAFRAWKKGQGKKG